MKFKKPELQENYTCNNGACHGPDCVHDYMNRFCPFCGFQFVKVSTNGHMFCSNHELICDYEGTSKEIEKHKPLLTYDQAVKRYKEDVQAEIDELKAKLKVFEQELI